MYALLDTSQAKLLLCLVQITQVDVFLLRRQRSFDDAILGLDFGVDREATQRHVAFDRVDFCAYDR